MKIKSFLIFALLIGVVSLFAFYPSKKSNEPTPKESIILQSIISFLDQVHFKPIPIDDTFSKNLFNDYLNVLDQSKRFLIKSDIDQMKQYELILDDEVRAGKLDFFDLSIKLLDNSLARTKNYTSEILSQPMNFDKKEVAQVDYDSLDYAKNEKELKERWYQALKYEVLQEIVDYQNRVKNDTSLAKTEPAKSFNTIEKESREKVLKDFDKMFDRISKLRREERLSDFLNIVCSEYDPHTSYMDPRDKEDFNLSMTGKLIGIGARLQTEGEYIKVVEVVPGGPAWKNKEMAVNDLIIKVKQEGEQPLDIRGMRIDDVVAKIRGKLGTTVTLTVKKPNGTTKDISLVREEVIMDEGFAKSEIISLEGVINNVGYINLPKFYADFEDNSGRFSSIDVAKEVEKLKKENVNGLIIDLRNNPGGSLNDVIKMCGLFIEKGPIVQVKSRDRKPYQKDDDDSGSFIYDGPLVILVNKNSASAAEIMAAALQDYKRAVIIGSQSTYGKGTVQAFFDLDRAVRGNDAVKPLGEVKATIQKYYRINGGSTQLKGVTPDIVLPDIYNYIKTGEEENKHAMSWSQVEPLNYSQNVFVIKNMEEVITNSKKRTGLNPVFSLIDQNAKRIEKQIERKTVPLDLVTYKSELEARKTEEKKYNELFKEIQGMNVTNIPEDVPTINRDSVKISRNQAFIKNIKKDVYLEEAIHVIKDLQSNKVAAKF